MVRALHRLGSDSTRDVCILVLVGEIFEAPLLGLGNKKCGEDSCQHEEGENLHAIRGQFFRWLSDKRIQIILTCAQRICSCHQC